MNLIEIKLSPSFPSHGAKKSSTSITKLKNFKFSQSQKKLAVVARRDQKERKERDIMC